MMRYSLFTFFLAFILGSCSKRCDCPAPPTHSGIATWAWIKTEGGIAPATTTPASTGKNIILKINADSTYSLSTNGAITSSGTYQNEFKTCIHDNRLKFWINFSNDQDMMVESLVSDSLQLSDELHDGYVSHYKRNQ